MAEVTRERRLRDILKVPSSGVGRDRFERRGDKRHALFQNSLVKRQRTRVDQHVQIDRPRAPSENWTSVSCVQVPVSAARGHWPTPLDAMPAPNFEIPKLFCQTVEYRSSDPVQVESDRIPA